MKHLKIFISLFLLLFFVGFQFMFSQVKKQKSFTVYLNNLEDNCSIKAEVCNKKSKIRYSDTLKYYWYSADRIIITQGASEGKVLHGKYSSFYYNNNLKEKGRYKKGLQNGQWMKWNNAGTLQEISHWHKGYRQGKQITFDSTGAKVCEASYYNGKLHGKWVDYNKGKIVSQKRYKKGIEILPKDKSEVVDKKDKKKGPFDKMKSWFKTKPKEAKPEKENKVDENSIPQTEIKSSDKKKKLFKKSQTPSAPPNTTNVDQPK